MPDDEANGVIPLDSKFGFAWRDWRVLDELARRTGRDEDAQGRGAGRGDPRRTGAPTAASNRSRTGSTGSMPGG